MPSLIGSFLKSYIKKPKEREEELPEAGLEEEGFFDVAKPYKKAAFEKLREQGVPEAALTAADFVVPDSPFDLVGPRGKPDTAAIRKMSDKKNVLDFKIPLTPAQRAVKAEQKAKQEASVNGVRKFREKITSRFEAKQELQKDIDTAIERITPENAELEIRRLEKRAKDLNLSPDRYDVRRRLELSASTKQQLRNLPVPPAPAKSEAELQKQRSQYLGQIKDMQQQTIDEERAKQKALSKAAREAELKQAWDNLKARHDEFLRKHNK